MWKTRAGLEAQLGAELTADLVARHLAEDPQFTGKFCRRPNINPINIIYIVKTFSSANLVP